MSKKGITIRKPKTANDFQALHNTLTQRGFVAIDVLKPGLPRSISLLQGDGAVSGAQAMAGCMGGGTWSNGPLSKVAWAFDERNAPVEQISDKDGKPIGLGYVKWGSQDNIPSVIPPLAKSSPYVGPPLRFLADVIAGHGPRLMYRFEDDTLCTYRSAGYRLLERLEKALKDEPQDTYGGYLAVEPGTGVLKPISALNPEDRPEPKLTGIGADYWRKAYEEWERSWLGEDEDTPGAKQFLEENNLDLHLSQCTQDDVYLDMYFPTVGFQRGRRGAWAPKIVRCDMLPASSCRLERMNEYRRINHVYFSDSLRTKGAGSVTVSTSAEDRKFTIYPACMPQHLVSDLRYIVESNQRTRVNARPLWVVCPTFYPSGNKPYYPQPDWWSIFTSKAFDFSSTVLYDKYKQRDNATNWSKCLYVSLDYLDQVFADEGYQGNKEKQQEFIEQLDNSMEQFLQQRENNGKMMRQWMWTGPDGKDHKSVEVVDVTEAANDMAKAGKEELELSTSPIFLALGVDPRLVGVPMVAASNGGTALREMYLVKQQQLSVKQRMYTRFLDGIATFNNWHNAEFHIIQPAFTTLDRSNTGVVETVAGEGA